MFIVETLPWREAFLPRKEAATTYNRNQWILAFKERILVRITLGGADEAWRKSGRQGGVF